MISPSSSSSSSSSSFGFIGLLDLPKEAVVGLDGQTILLKTDDFVGVKLPPQVVDRSTSNGWHLVTVRSQPNATVAVGFLVVNGNEDEPRPYSSLVRRYDPQTEEVSSEPVDERTTRNLLEQIQNQQLPPSRVVDYSKIVSDTQAQLWSDQTTYITASNILQKRGLTHGDKIVPGSYQDESEPLPPPTTSSLSSSVDKVIDGKSLQYPSIPVVDATLSLRTNRHAGTSQYLSQLSPSERTQLFCEPQIASRLLRDVLANDYDHSWQALLGDLQLAYVLFLYLQCLASLEHWYVLIYCY
jgi:hypothetical protein